jgi:DNA-binding SARP family transcriptional activator
VTRYYEYWYPVLAPDMVIDGEAAFSRPGPAVRLSLLQGFQLECPEGEVILPLSPQRVLAFLALQSRPSSRTYVASALWLDCDEERAAASLRTALWRINRCGHYLVTADTQMLRLNPDVAVDLRENARRARGILRGEGAAEDLSVDDLSVTGDLLPGWYDEWVVSERERYRQLRLHALEKLCRTLALTGRYDQAIEAGLAAVSSEPLRESAHQVLILAYMEEGNAGEAIRQYDICRKILHCELGVEPSAATQALLPASVKMPAPKGLIEPARPGLTSGSRT